MGDLIREIFLPPAKSTLAGETDALFIFINIASFILLAGITAAIIYFAYRYRRRSENDVTPLIIHNSKLEVTWSVIPLIITFVIFSWGFKTYVKLNSPPEDAYEIHVTAQKWLWRFSYENGATMIDTLHVPANRPVKLIMKSQDVLHSFYVPDFRVKHDVIPNRYSSVWFEVTEPGESFILCTEYCGLEHSDMHGMVVAHDQEDFEDWLAANEGGMLADLPPVERGKKLFTQNACQSCHSLDGSQMVGPTFKGLWGKNEQLASGETVAVDENYIRESILNPQAKIAAGYGPVMPSYQGQLSDDQISAIIEYIKTID